MTTQPVEKDSAGRSQRVQDPANLVCPRCWEVCFSTREFRDLCQARKERRVSYQIDKKYLRESASKGCGWCSLIDGLAEINEDMMPPESSGNMDIVQIEVGAGMSHEYYTPEGNNRYRLWINGAVVYLSAFATEHSGVSDLVTARPLHTEVASNLTFQKIHQWVEDCSTHSECRLLSDSLLPSRLIEVATEDSDGQPRIASTKGQRGKYAALSYCWGGRQSGMTLTNNFASRMRRLDTKELSKTVVQAIQTAKRMGLRYIWIDAICIIQDDEEDRTNEIRQMCDIYRRAYITIVAANAARSDQGFLESRPEPLPPTEIPFWTADGNLSCVCLQPQGWYDDSSEPINTRCWTLQERLLSSRIVIFASHTVQLQCKQKTVNLGGSLNLPAGLASWRLPSGLTYPLRDIEARGLTTEQIIEAWKQVIVLYSGRKIKRVEERLVALSGLAQAFHEVLRTPYLAGLWSGPTLPSMLLWIPSGADPGVSVPQAYLAPSWSWASRLGSISYQFGHKLGDMKPFDVEVLSSAIELQKPSLPFGGISAGRIVLKAYLQLATFVPPMGLAWKTPVSPQPARPPTPPSGIYGPGFTMPDCVIHATLDDEIPRREKDVTCIALTSRSYEYGGVLYTAVDGLLLQRTASVNLPLEYQRIGRFVGAMHEEFAVSERELLALV